MQPTTPEESGTTEAKPVQVGIAPGQVERLTEEIAHSGVANSEADVERLATEGPETGGDDTPTVPTPIITSS